MFFRLQSSKNFTMVAVRFWRSPERHFQTKRANYRPKRWIMALPCWECRELGNQWNPMEYSYGVGSPFGQSFWNFGEVWLWAKTLILYWSSLLASKELSSSSMLKIKTLPPWKRQIAVIYETNFCSMYTTQVLTGSTVHPRQANRSTDSILIIPTNSCKKTR